MIFVLSPPYLYHTFLFALLSYSSNKKFIIIDFFLLRNLDNLFNWLFFQIFHSFTMFNHCYLKRYNSVNEIISLIFLKFPYFLILFCVKMQKLAAVIALKRPSNAIRELEICLKCPRIG